MHGDEEKKNQMYKLPCSVICQAMTNLLNVYNRLIEITRFSRTAAEQNFVNNIKVYLLEMKMTTLSQVVLLILILIEAGKGSREINTRRDLIERVDAVEKSMDLLKEGFRSLAFLLLQDSNVADFFMTVDMMKGVKDKSDTVSANEEPGSIEYEQAPYTQKDLKVYEMREYPSVNWVCTEEPNKLKWKGRKIQDKMFNKLFR